MYWLEQFIPQNLADWAILVMLFLLLSLSVCLVLPITRHLIVWRYRDNQNISKVLFGIGYFGILAFVTLFYSSYVEPNLLVVGMYQYDIPEVDWQDKPLRLAVLGDLQYKGVASPSYLNEVITRTNSLNPDLVFWIGDLLEDDPSEMDRYVNLAGVEAPLGKFAILGNHDYHNANRIGLPDFIAANQVVDYFNRSGFQILRNSAVEVYANGQTLTIAGTDTSWFGLHDFDLTNSRVIDLANEVNILLAHEPATVIDNETPEIYSLVFSGHCHGGQVNLGFLNSFLGLPHIPRGCVAQDGRAEGLLNINGHSTFVTRGLGTTDLRIRFGSKPEIMVVDIV